MVITPAFNCMHSPFTCWISYILLKTLCLSMAGYLQSLHHKNNAIGWEDKEFYSINYYSG
uniref:Uncharacterized protein n=1 Tax=Rhizophora mucronata TaxID=61149 RepID=A0A2P2P0C8_RHIMU